LHNVSGSARTDSPIILVDHGAVDAFTSPACPAEF
jgi:hypothetical protein